jgi:hypothetical protein
MMVEAHTRRRRRCGRVRRLCGNRGGRLGRAVERAIGSRRLCRPTRQKMAWRAGGRGGGDWFGASGDGGGGRGRRLEKRRGRECAKMRVGGCVAAS